MTPNRDLEAISGHPYPPFFEPLATTYLLNGIAQYVRDVGF